MANRRFARHTRPLHDSASSRPGRHGRGLRSDRSTSRRPRRAENAPQTGAGRPLPVQARVPIPGEVVPRQSCSAIRTHLGSAGSGSSRWSLSKEWTSSPFLRSVHPEPAAVGHPDSVTLSAAGLHSGVNAGALRLALRQLADGVRALHSANIVHRDLKPSNVLVRADGHLVVLDFGIAKQLRGRGGDVVDGLAWPPDVQPSGRTFREWTENHDILGSVPYMSPEQASGGEVGVASDWYTVGVMLYEALTGTLPFLGDTLTVLARKQAGDPIAPRMLCADVPGRARSAVHGAALSQSGGARRWRGNSGAALGRTQGELRARRTTDRIYRTGSAARDPRCRLRELEHHRAVTVHVRGKSGAGKTALTEHFLSGLPPA